MCYLAPMLVASLFLTFLTGVAALIYEVAWHRYLHNLLGNHAYATALILAVFLAGLGIGYRAFGFYAKKLSAQKLIKLTGILEIFIGLWGILFLLIYKILWTANGVIGLHGAFSTLVDIFVIALFILLPTICMGGTLPLLTQGLSGGKVFYGRIHAFIYAFNTFGAFVGCLLAGFFLLPNLGLSGSVTIALSINILAGIAFILISKNARQEQVGETELENKIPKPIKLSVALIIAFLAGFYSLTYQSIFIRLTGLSVGASEYAFPLIVGTFILLIALGSGFLVGTTKRISLLKNQLILFFSLAILYFLIPYWAYLFYLLRINIPSEIGYFYTFYFLVFLILFLFLAIPVAAMGATIPLVFANIKAKNQELGNVVGKIYGINTIGTVLGCLLGGYYLLYWFDFSFIFSIALFFVALTTSLLSQSKKVTFSVLTVLVIVTLNTWNPRYIGIGLFHERQANEHTYQGRRSFYEDFLKGIKLIDYKDGPNTSVTILDFAAEEDEPESRSLLVNGKSDGNTEGDKFTTKLIAHLPALLAGTSSRQAAIIGFGIGSTAGALNLYPTIEEIDNIEISSAVADFANYFNDANGNFNQSAKNNWVIEDAYRYLAQTEKKYATILSGLSNPWLSGIDRLFTVEFFEIIKKRLAEDGIFLQWMSLASTAPETVRMIVATLKKVFPNYYLFNSEDSFFIVCAKQPLDKNNILNLQNRFTIPAIKKDLAELNIFSPEILLALEKWIPDRALNSEVVNTLEHTVLGYWAGKDFFLDSVSVLESLMKEDDWEESLKFSKKSLLAKLVEENPNVNLEHILQASCGGAKVKLIEPDWRKQRTVCRDAAVALMLKGHLKMPDYLSNEIEIVRRLMAEDIIPLEQDEINRASRYIRYFKQYDSIFNPFSYKKLLWKLSTCYSSNTEKNIQCRRELISALDYAGYSELAASERKRLEKEA